MTRTESAVAPMRAGRGGREGEKDARRSRYRLRMRWMSCARDAPHPMSPTGEHNRDHWKE